MNKFLIIALFLSSVSSISPKNHCSFNKKCNKYFYSKVAPTVIVGPLVGTIIGIANKQAESKNALLLEKVMLWILFGMLNGLATKSASCALDALDIPHSERGLGTTAWLASWVAYFATPK